MGCGFKVYDVMTYEGEVKVITVNNCYSLSKYSDAQGHPKPLASVVNAHQQPITCMVFLQDR
jgi:hypothetical protein